MYYWVISADRDLIGPYYTSEKAESMKTSGYDEVFASHYSRHREAAQEYREKHPEFRHKNFKRQR